MFAHQVPSKEVMDHQGYVSLESPFGRVFRTNPNQISERHGIARTPTEGATASKLSKAPVISDDSLCS